MNHYFVIHKPFHVLSQFTSADDKKTLKDYFDVPSDVYPVGRLDYDSEGLLILTNDKRLNHFLLEPKYQHLREYWVQIEGDISQEAINKLEQGIQINIDGRKYRSRPCVVKKFSVLPPVSERNPPVRFRKTVPDSWISIILSEGKNRQVRKMTAASGFPTLRLIRFRIEGLTLDSLLPGDMKILHKQELYNLLNIKF